MLKGNSMIGINILLPLLSLAVNFGDILGPRVVIGNDSVTVRNVRWSSRSLGVENANFAYGQFEILVDSGWTQVCDDSMDENTAQLFCKALGSYTDSLYQPGFLVDPGSLVEGFDFSCTGSELSIQQCITKRRSSCPKNTAVMLYCSYGKENNKLDIRIRGGSHYGTLEVNSYGFWGPICNVDWTNKEASTACRTLGYKGGVTYFGRTEVPGNPLVVGGFNCTGVKNFSDCSYKTLSENWQCPQPLSLDSPQSSAGVLCYRNEGEAIEFRLSDRWYGKVEIKYDSEWGRVCDKNWDNHDADVICRQLGYVGGTVDTKQTQDLLKAGPGYVRMDDVNCAGTEKTLLDCEHSAMWRPQATQCQDAAVICNVTTCGSLDIRNRVCNLRMLDRCSVIEGNLTILLIDVEGQESYDQYSFPNLVEITDFLLLFRADGLKSLSKLFPNLAIIRGDKLFLDYALVAFEMPDLEVLGLPSLVSIPNGAVRLDKNPNLCYVETIDWSKITTGVALEDNYFQHNKDVKECVNRCNEKCPRFTVNGEVQQYCWGHQEDHCQKMLTCPSTCPSGVCHNEVCCDQNCVAGCTGPSAKQCTACRDVKVRDSDQFPRCAQRCTAGTYKFRKHRCLYEQECINFTEYKTDAVIPMTSVNILKLVDWNNINQVAGLCVEDCPSGYNTNDDPNYQQKCVKCRDKECPKICDLGRHIDSVTSAKELINCNIIKGPLVINLLRGREVGMELELSMVNVTEITEFLQITHANPLLSLHFLKNLKRIGGDKLYKDRFSVYVHDNMNLQELFTKEVMSNLTIGAGELHFQYNRKLCFSKIHDFVKYVGYENKTSTEEVSPQSNGDEIACDIMELKFIVFATTPHIAFINYTKVNMTDPRQLIGYTINWKEAPVRNASIYNGRDACSDDLWNTDEICYEDSRCDSMGYITGLEPWTQYAVYMQAVTVTKAIQGAISDIVYFRTAAEVPTSPTDLKVTSENPGELRVTWNPPKKPRGNVTHYQVYWQRRDMDTPSYELRDYCKHPLMSNDPIDKQKKEDEEKGNKTKSADCCACPKTEQEKLVDERERNYDIRFQDYLQNAIYVKRLNQSKTTMATNRMKSLKPTRTRREVSGIAPSPTVKGVVEYRDPLNTSSAVSLNMSAAATSHEPLVTTEIPLEPFDKENMYYYADVYEYREFVITGLGHFQDYNVEVIACQDRMMDIKKKLKMKCSQEALGFGRTMPDDTADTVNARHIVVTQVTNKTGAVHIKWEDPAEPNGLIITYEIEFGKSTLKNVQPNVVCITYRQYRDEGHNGHTIDKLEAGNYTFRIRATSLAGNGSWTQPLYFNIPAISETTLPPATLITVLCVSVLVIIIIIGIAVWFVAKRQFKPDEALVSRNPIYDDSYLVYQPDEWEVEREKVQVLKELGQGSFGMVYEGVITICGEESIRVAVKTTNNNSNDHDRYQFLKEASIMKAFNCHHVVKLVGVVSKDQPVYVLMELMPRGDLKNYLRQHRPDTEENDGRPPPTVPQILQMAGEIADGMAYLADKKYVHRDLAARNCMVGDDLTVKIADFGMTRDIYETDYYRKGSRGLLPVRWMAPESLKDGLFTSMTDVWSYGVVLWEMVTLAQQPYQGLSNEEVLRYVGSGKIMEMPERCPSKIYHVMVKCWRYRPKHRPTFKEIIEGLLPDLDKNFQEVSYFFSEENAKYEESKLQGATAQESEDIFDHVDNDSDLLDDDDDPQCPVNDYVDEAQLPMLGVGASNGHSVELQDIFSDTGTYPHYSGSHNKQHVGSAEVCDCGTNFLDDEDDGAAAQSAAAQFVVHNRRSVCSSPNSAIVGSSDGSKESSKSSSSSYAHMNGVSVANGHVPVHVRTTPC